MNVYEYEEGWIVHGGFVFRWRQDALDPCYIRPFPLTNVSIGIDGLEFV